MIRSLSLRMRCANASTRGSEAVVDCAAPAAEAEERELVLRALAPLLLLFFVVRLAAVERLPLARLPVDRLPVERLVRPLPDDPPELDPDPDPLLLACGMPYSFVSVDARTLVLG
jgi:hypothetical protein